MEFAEKLIALRKSRELTQEQLAGHFYFEIWNASVILAELLIATAIVVFVWVRSFPDKS